MLLLPNVCPVYAGLVERAFIRALDTHLRETIRHFHCALFASTAGLLQALGFDPIGLDGLQARSGLPTPQLQAQLMELELLGMVARLPGGKFQRIARA